MAENESPDPKIAGSEDSRVEEVEEYEVEEKGGNTKRPGLQRIKSYASGAEGYDDTRVEGLLSRQRTTATLASTMTTHESEFEVDWEENDPGNPRQWPLWKRACTIAAMSYGTSCV